MRQEGSIDDRSIQIAVGFRQTSASPRHRRDEALKKLKEERNGEDEAPRACSAPREPRGRSNWTATTADTPRAHQAAAQIIENLPAIDKRERIRRASRRGCGRDSREDP